MIKPLSDKSEERNYLRTFISTFKGNLKKQLSIYREHSTDPYLNHLKGELIASKIQLLGYLKREVNLKRVSNTSLEKGNEAIEFLIELTRRFKNKIEKKEYKFNNCSTSEIDFIISELNKFEEMSNKIKAEMKSEFDSNEILEAKVNRFDTLMKNSQKQCKMLCKNLSRVSESFHEVEKMHVGNFVKMFQLAAKRREESYKKLFTS
jgi:predicted nuclease with TOPRIM domain